MAKNRYRVLIEQRVISEIFVKADNSNEVREDINKKLEKGHPLNSLANEEPTIIEDSISVAKVEFLGTLPDKK